MNINVLSRLTVNLLFVARKAKDKRQAEQQQKQTFNRVEKLRSRSTACVVFVLLLASGTTMKAQDASSPTDFVSEAAAIKVRSKDSEKTTFQWKSALVDASLFLGLEHGFRLAQDPLVRQKLGGPFIKDYIDSVKSIHGWGDGDPFMVNYVGHPTMGAVAGFIETNHDPRYYSVEVGASPRYWKSRLRAMAFSAAFSLQFEIGPISEASLGNVQQKSRNDGVVD